MTETVRGERWRIGEMGLVTALSDDLRCIDERDLSNPFIPHGAVTTPWCIALSFRWHRAQLWRLSPCADYLKHGIINESHMANVSPLSFSERWQNHLPAPSWGQSAWGFVSGALS